MSQTVDFKTTKELRDAGFPWVGWETNPTAMEIIEQMPRGTHIKKNNDECWYVWFELPSFQRDFRHDECPHRAAAKAFIAWKKGLE